MNHVYVKTDNGRGFIKCFLLDKSSRYRDLSLEEIKESRYQEKLNRSIYSSTELQEEVALSAKLEAIVEKATKRMEEQIDTTLTKTERKSGIRKHRAEEKDEIRKSQSYELGKPQNSKEEQEVNVTSMDTYRPKSKLELLASIKEERIHG